jgi:O-antigen ligase
MIEAVKYLILLVALVTSASSRRWSLPIFCFFLPLSQWMPAIPIPAVNAMNLLLLPVLVRALAAGPPREENGRKDPLLIPIGLFMLFMIISWARVHFGSGPPPEFYRYDGIYTNIVLLKEYISTFIFYFCARRLTRDPEDRRLVLLGVVAGFGFEALTAAREFLFSNSWRATAHLSQPNKLGHFLAAYMMIPLGFFLTRKARYKLPSISLVLMGLLGLLGAISRGAIMAGGLAVLLVCLLKRSVWLIPLILAILLAPLWLPDDVMQRFDEATMESDDGGIVISAKEGRVALWKAAASMIVHNPMGVGLSQYKFQLYNHGYEGRRIRSSHNVYLQLATEQGILAALVHVFMMLYLANASFRLSRTARSPDDSAIGLGMLGLTLSFIGSGMFGDGFYQNNLSGLFWVMAGLVTAMRPGPDAASGAGEAESE